MRTGNEFLSERENPGLSLVRVDKDNPAMDVAFFAGYKSVASLDRHVFWTSDNFGSVLEKGAKFPNENQVSFECFKSIANDEKAFCPGCMVPNHTGTKPTRFYYAPIIDDKTTGVQILEMKSTVGNKLRKMVNADFISAEIPAKFADFWFKLSYTAGIAFGGYEIDRSLQELAPDFERPEWDVSGKTNPMGDFLQTLRVIRDMEDVVLDMQLNNLWLSDMEKQYKAWQKDNKVKSETP